MAGSIQLNSRASLEVDCSIAEMANQPRYCTMCKLMKQTSEMATVFSTAFYRKSLIDYHLGICESCNDHRNQAEADKGNETCHAQYEEHEITEEDPGTKSVIGL